MGCSLHPRSSIVLIITSIAADNISSGESSAFNGRIPEAAEVLSASLEQLPILPTDAAAAAAPRPPWLPPQTEQRHPAIAIGFMRGEAICAGRHGEGMNLRHHDVRQRQIKAAAPSLPPQPRRPLPRRHGPARGPEPGRL